MFHVLGASSLDTTVWDVTGEEWYGSDLKFDRRVSFFEAPDLITLTEDDSGYDV